VTTGDDEARADLDATALARVLDGLDELDADGAAREAHERAAADVALIARAFGLLGDALAAPVEEPTAPVAEDNNVVALPLWRRRPGRTLLAAAASIAVMGLGVTVVVANNDDSSDSNHSATAASGAVTQAPPMAPAPEAQYRSNALSAAPADTGAAADSAAGTAQSAPAAAAPAPAPASKAAASTKSAPANDGTGESLADAVACARGILIGEIVSFQPTGGGTVSLTLKVTDWLSPSSGPTQITYIVGDNDEDGSASTLKKGQKGLFVVPRSTSASVYTFTGPDYTSARAKVAKAQDQDSDVQC
jgi:hypothetical protein